MKRGGQSKARSLTPMIFFANNTLQLEKLQLEVAECTSQGRLALLVLRPMTPVELYAFAWRGALKGLSDAENLRCHCASHIEVHWRDIRRTIKIAIDGECIECKLPLNVVVKPDALAVLVPRDPEPRK